MNINVVVFSNWQKTIEGYPILGQSDWLITFVHPIFSIKACQHFTQYLDRNQPAYAFAKNGAFRGLMY